MLGLFLLALRRCFSLKYVELGRTGIKVSRLCLGTLPLGPLQAHLDVKAGSRVIRTALELGINFLDTAKIYRTYPYIREALKGWPEPVVLATKSYDFTREGMKESLEEARRALDREVIDIFLLHEQETEQTLAGHREALDFLLEAKAKGLIRAVGISTHAVAAVRASLKVKEIDVVHPLINMEGLGILDGTLEEMLAAVKEAFLAGKGIYAMKALGGGHLAGRAEEALTFVLNLPFVHSVAVGMQSVEEVMANVAWVLGEEVPSEVLRKIKNKKRRLHIEEWCRGCGSCVERCPQGALKLEKGRAVVEEALCILCGYCASSCRDFCLKVV